ncbi:MAG: serine/threonine protein kinase, partial [Polyangiaceae bacterium]|nr:serine/threonine protein kinase [Polyangiaceae bacterium]
MTQETSEFQHLVGSVLAERYRINALLGAGGMGAVFDAEHLLMRKRVALKLLLPGVSQSGEMVARFEREAMAAANIDHPNVTGATDFGKLPDGSFYLVLEFVEGRNL